MALETVRLAVAIPRLIAPVLPAGTETLPVAIAVVTLAVVTLAVAAA